VGPVEGYKQEASDELLVGLASREGKAALKRYVRALGEVRASYAALNPSVQRSLELKAPAIEHDIVKASAMAKTFPGRARCARR